MKVPCLGGKLHFLEFFLHEEKGILKPRLDDNSIFASSKHPKHKR